VRITAAIEKDFKAYIPFCILHYIVSTVEMRTQIFKDKDYRILWESKTLKQRKIATPCYRDQYKHLSVEQYRATHGAATFTFRTNTVESVVIKPTEHKPVIDSAAAAI